MVHVKLNELTSKAKASVSPAEKKEAYKKLSSAKKQAQSVQKKYEDKGIKGVKLLA